jgi:hypothetical protein
LYPQANKKRENKSILENDNNHNNNNSNNNNNNNNTTLTGTMRIGPQASEKVRRGERGIQRERERESNEEKMTNKSDDESGLA